MYILIYIYFTNMYTLIYIMYISLTEEWQKEVGAFGSFLDSGTGALPFSFHSHLCSFSSSISPILDKMSVDVRPQIRFSFFEVDRELGDREVVRIRGV
jgi:hypothetical protein